MTNFPVKFPHVSPEVKLKYEEFTIFSEKRILLTKQKKNFFRATNFKQHSQSKLKNTKKVFLDDE